MSLFDPNTIFSGRIRVGSASVRLRIFFDAKNLKEIRYYVDQYYQSKGILWRYKEFLDIFRKFMVPVIINTLETDRYLVEISSYLRKIEVMVALTDKDTGASTSPEAISARYIPLSLSLNTLILNLTKDISSSGKYNSAMLRKSIEHELFHVYHNDSFQGDWITVMSMMIEQIKKGEQLINLNPDLSLKYSTITSAETDILRYLMMTKSEGVASFRMYEHSQRIPINSMLIRKSSGKMNGIAMSSPDSPEIKRLMYILGAFMCIIIALGRLKAAHREQEVSIIVGNKTFPLSQLDECLRSLDVFSISQLPQDVFHEVLADLPKMNSEKFLEEYDRMCGVLGISPARRILSWEEYTTFLGRIRGAKKKVDEYLSSRGFQPE